MRPVKHEGCNFVYLGPSPDIGDLHVMRRPGPEGGTVVEVVYELDDEDRERIAQGGRIMLGIYSEPIPPVSMQVIDEGMCRPVAEHGWKTIAELDDPERRPSA